MRVKAKKIKDGFLIPLIDRFKDKDEIEVEIYEEETDFLRFLREFYGGRENISKLSDEEALEIELRDKYEL